MQIELRAGPGFEHTLPGGGEKAVLQLADGATLVDVLAQLDLSKVERFLTAVNEDVVVKSQRADRVLQSGDVVDILPPLTGG